MDSLKTMFFFCFVFYIYLFLYTRACTSHNKHVEVRGRLWETMWVLGTEIRHANMAESIFILRPSCCFQRSVRACVCVFNPVSHCSSHFVLSILELDWLATELWISSVSYHIITGSFYRGAGDHDTPVFLIVYQLNHLSSS